MVTNNSDPLWNFMYQTLTGGLNAIRVKSDFKGKMGQIKNILDSDETGMISTILEYMIRSATTDIKFETSDTTKAVMFNVWMDRLNRNMGIDFPSGLRSLTTNYFRERWKSSFIALNMRWERVRVPNLGFVKLPTRIWVADGSTLKVREKANTPTGFEYLLPHNGKDIVLPLRGENTTIIRKPYNSPYEKWPTPYLSHKGALFQALFQKHLLQKQADLVEAILPYLLSAKAGTDALAKLHQLPDDVELKELRKQIRNIKEQYNDRTGSRGLVGSFSYDVELEHLIPDLTKFINNTVMAPSERKLLASLGLVELEGFSNSRQEAILNPKVMVEEVRDGVADWVVLLEEIVNKIFEENRREHPKKFTVNDTKVIPAPIKSFVTNDMKQIIRSWYDRGILSKQAAVEGTTDFNFETEISRRDLEKRRGLEDDMFPPVVQNLDNKVRPDVNDPTKENSPEKTKTEEDIQSIYCESCEDYVEAKNERCPKCEKLIDPIFALKEEIMAPFDSNSDLPENIKNVLPQGAQTIWRKAFNSAEEQGESEETAIKIAWSAVKKVYKKNSNGEWVRRENAKIETIDDLPEYIKKNFAISNRIKLVQDLNK